MLTNNLELTGLTGRLGNSQILAHFCDLAGSAAHHDVSIKPAEISLELALILSRGEKGGVSMGEPCGVEMSISISGGGADALVWHFLSSQTEKIVKSRQLPRQKAPSIVPEG